MKNPVQQIRRVISHSIQKLNHKRMHVPPYPELDLLVELSEPVDWRFWQFKNINTFIRLSKVVRQNSFYFQMWQHLYNRCDVFSHSPRIRPSVLSHKQHIPASLGHKKLSVLPLRYTNTKVMHVLTKPGRFCLHLPSNYVGTTLPVTTFVQLNKRGKA